MSSVLDPQPDPSASDELVAYLDGELPPPDCRRVESRLATDDAYRQQLHELDRAWEALDALPTPTVDDAFARSTIELACVAAEADLTDHTAIARAAKRNRARRWVAAGVAATVIGFLAVRAVVPNRNEAVVADLPAIHQVNVLPFVTNVEFLRRLAASVPLEQLVKDEPAYNRNVAELENANSASLETRREWIQNLPPEQKADLADCVRTFEDLQPASGEQQRMRQVMADIRSAENATDLQQMLVAYGQWLSRHPAGLQEQLREGFEGKSSDQQVALVKKFLEREGELALRHLSPEDADVLRREIIRIAKEKRPEFMERMRQARKAGRLVNPDEQLPRQAMSLLVTELLNDTNREETSKQLVDKLSAPARDHWENLGRGGRPYGRKWQLWIWIQDAMKLKVDAEKLEEFFASDKLTPVQRQQLLNQPRARMEAELETLYYRSLGIENPGQLFGDPGRMPRGGPGHDGQWRPDGPLGPGEPDSPDGRRPRPRFGPRVGPDGAPQRRPDDRGRQPLDRPPQPGPGQPPPQPPEQPI